MRYGKSIFSLLSFWTFEINLHLISHLDTALRKSNGWKKFLPLEYRLLIPSREGFTFLALLPNAWSINSGHLSVVLMN